MNHRATIQRSLDYIEQNLRAEITAGELADLAGYSVYHFYRVFQSAVGMPVMQYIQRRRLVHAIYAVRHGKAGVQAALEYGFDTYAGFYKAFRREYGMAPSEFLRSCRAQRPYRIDLEKEDLIVVTRKKAAQMLKNWNVDGQVADLGGAYGVGDAYVLKYTANLGKVRSHIALSRAIESVGLRAASPVRTVRGCDYVQDGEIYYYLTRRIPGRTMRTGEFDPRFAGEIIGQLHLALKTVDVCVDEADLPGTVKSWALPAAREALGLEENFCRGYLEKLDALYPKLPRQIIHRDPNPGNIIRSDGGWGFVDFELSERNVRIYDPCYAATAVLSECFADGAQGWKDVCREILLGYDSVVKLTAQEWEAIPYILLANQFVCLAWFKEQEKYAELYEINRDMTKWLMAQLGMK